MTNNEPVARFQGVGHAYGKAQILDIRELDIPSGCMAGLIGPDGVGKSTLLALLSGVRRLQQGRLEVLGGDMADLGHRSRVCPRIAYMPQGLGKNLYMSLTIRENIEYFAKLFDQAREEREQRMAELLESTGLAPFAHRPAGKLSGGMKQKLGLCCALIHDPDLLILDEPTTGVDPLSRRQFWQLIERIRSRRPNLSVVVATAYMEEAMGFAWLAAMDNGRILATGTPAELLQRTGARDLDQAFIQLLPEAKRSGHKALVAAPYEERGQAPAITAKGLTMRFGSFTAVHEVDFEIRRGEIFGFLGSNGCGKTTTMKMLTGLLKPSQGTATILGRPAEAHVVATRMRVGYMTQAFSLYNELSVRHNLELHARLYRIPAERLDAQVERMLERFDLRDHAQALPGDLPLGIKQRLSLAVAMIHDPELLILDEPTSGVDPVARDKFWEMLLDLSRNQGVTIFVSTHFMNEGERCDRVSLMHAGKVLACDAPARLAAQCGCATLEDAFIFHLKAAAKDADEDLVQAATPSAHQEATAAPRRFFSTRRLLATAQRETREVLRDPVRLVVSLLGSVILLFILGYGITFDVEDLNFAVLDRDQSPESRDFIENVAGSRYFRERPPLAGTGEMDERMRAGELAVALEIPPDYGKDLQRGRDVEIGVWIDGSMPFRAETIRGYMDGLHLLYLNRLYLETLGNEAAFYPAGIQVRYRYNQDFKSLEAMVPAVIPVLLVFIPAIMMALGVVREKEMGSIINMYATPVTRLEFLVGKQLAYVGVSMVSFLGLVALSVTVFHVQLKGSLATLGSAALLFVIVTTGIGLLVSCFTRTQVAAMAVTAVSTLLVTISFSGLITPVASMQGPGRFIGRIFPVTYFLNISRGVFSKALGFEELTHDFLLLAVYIPVFLGLSILFLRKQEA